MSNNQKTDEKELVFNDNHTWVDEAVYFIYNIKDILVIIINVIIILVLIFNNDISDIENIVMFLIGNNTGLIANNNHTNKKQI